MNCAKKELEKVDWFTVSLYISVSGLLVKTAKVTCDLCSVPHVYVTCSTTGQGWIDRKQQNISNKVL